MSQIFIELYNYRPAWFDLDREGRERFSAGIRAAVADLTANGVEVVGGGINDPESDRRAPHDFFCIYRVPDFDFQRAFDAAIAASGWYDYFEQQSVSGTLTGIADVLAANVALERPEPRA